jgi:non-ribosomal peptide synthetase component F
VFGALCSGGCLHLLSSEAATDPGLWRDYFATHRIDCLKIVPSHLQALLSGGVSASVLPRSVLVLGGEASRWEFVERLRQAAPGLRVLNHYGPTETTVGVLTYEVGGERAPGSVTVPLGRPLPNSRVYLLNAQGQPVPLGVAGGVGGGAGVT